jgi:hypothetical protein
VRLCSRWLVRLILLVWLCGGVAHAAEPRTWAIDMPGLGPIALLGDTPEQAVTAYVQGP